MLGRVVFLPLFFTISLHMMSLILVLAVHCMWVGVSLRSILVYITQLCGPSIIMTPMKV